MTGRELIMFILENHLEDVECLTEMKKKIPGVKIGEKFYIPEDTENPF